MKKKSNKNLMYRRDKYIQYLIIAYNQKESEKGWIYKSLYCIPETLWIHNKICIKNISVKKVKIKKRMVHLPFFNKFRIIFSILNKILCRDFDKNHI